VKPLIVGLLALACLGTGTQAAAQAAVPTPTQTPPAAGTTTPADGSVVSASGLRFQSLREGTGSMPTASDTVRVHYRGTLASGLEFDSSYRRGEPAEFRLDHVIACWTEGVQLMRIGGRAHLTCPPQIAYGARGAGGVIPPNATLQFDIELLGIAPR
jgi:FKBP-type peptidyl-prolyl cis-trans isomerase FkpA